MELEHGIRRAKEPAQAVRRRQFLEDPIGNVPVYPVSTELARKAGRIDQSSKCEGTVLRFRTC